jgi:hypothetical protein
LDGFIVASAGNLTANETSRATQTLHAFPEGAFPETVIRSLLASPMHLFLNGE